VDDLAKHALHEPGGQEHEHGTDHEDAGVAPVPRQVLHAGMATGEQERVREQEPGRTADGDGEQLGRPVGEHPGPELQPEPALLIQCAKGAQHDAVGKEEQEGRYGEGEA
jgi:hypothetical protein